MKDFTLGYSICFVFPASQTKQVMDACEEFDIKNVSVPLSGHSQPYHHARGRVTQKTLDYLNAVDSQVDLSTYGVHYHVYNDAGDIVASSKNAPKFVSGKFRLDQMLQGLGLSETATGHALIQDAAITPIPDSSATETAPAETAPAETAAHAEQVDTPFAMTGEIAEASSVDVP